MKLTTLHQARSIRFRRWSRVGYAVFCSLAVNVSIGSVAVSIMNKSLQKAVDLSESSLFATDLYSKEKINEDVELEIAVLNLHAATLAEETIERTAACGFNTYLFFINLRLI